MKFFSAAPFVRFLVPLLSGIFIYSHFNVSFLFSFVLLVLSFLLCFLFVVVPALSSSYKFRGVFGFFVFLFFVALGFLITANGSYENNSFHYQKHLTEKPQYAYVTLVSEPVLKGKSAKVIVDVKAIKSNNNWQDCSGKSMLYFKNDYDSLRYGQELIVKTVFNQTEAPRNPGEFNYKKYLFYKGIGYTAFVYPGNFSVINNNVENSLYGTALAFRKYLITVFKEKNISGQELAVASALILGFDDDVDADMISSYSATGTLHVLSVSGLHVGILFVFIGFVTKALKRYKYGNLIRGFIMLSAIWFYAFLTGLAPAVQRSAVMFSFLIIADMFRRQTNIYNTIAASAFLLVLINPYLLFDIGFQLSYMAVVGIVYVYPKLFSLLEPENKILNFVWSLVCVSIAAQLATFPLSLYYFHQFPNGFLIANILVIPLAAVALYAGVLLFFVSSIAFIGEWLAKIVEWLIVVVNSIVDFMANLPYSTINNVVIGNYEVIFIYISIIVLLFYFSTHTIKALYVCLVSIVFVFSFQLFRYYNIHLQKRIVVYNTKASTAIDLIAGNESVFVSNSVTDYDLDFHITPNRIQSGIKHIHFFDSNEFFNQPFASVFMKNNFIGFAGKKMFLLNRNKVQLASAVKVDYIIVSANAFVNIKEIKENFIFEKVIIDASNSKKQNKLLVNLFIKHDIPFYSVPDSGAFIVEA